jgi:hypothetical protein
MLAVLAGQTQTEARMEKTAELISRTEDLLQQIETLQSTIHELHTELLAHTEQLGLRLAKLRKQPPAPPPRAAGAAERRATPRRKGNPVPVQIRNGDNLPTRGWVLDRSMGGLRVMVDEALPPGTMLSVRPVKVPEAFPWVPVRVKNCYAERKSWNLNCQFVERISGRDLQQFG